MMEISASEFKAKCLALLDQVSQTHETVTILKRGKPVAQLVPAAQEQAGYPQTSLRGSVRFLGDIMGPAVAAREWEAEARRE